MLFLSIMGNPVRIGDGPAAVNPAFSGLLEKDFLGMESHCSQIRGWEGIQGSWEVRRPARTGILLSERGHPEGPEDMKGNPPDRKYRSGFFCYSVLIRENCHEKLLGEEKVCPSQKYGGLREKEAIR